MRVTESRDGYCEMLKDAEPIIVGKLAVLGYTDDPRLGHVCDEMLDWELQVAPSYSWTSTALTQVSGQTYCPQHLMVVNNEAPLNGSLAHEMVHAAQHCQPVPPYDEKDFYHSNWAPRIYQVLDEIESGR